MNYETRERLHAVLAYLVESEAQDYWLRRQPAARENHVYTKALCLIRHFGFSDLLEEDAAWRGSRSHPEELEEA
jgi:hypothetical protein